MQFLRKQLPDFKKKLLKLLNRDTSPNRTVYNVPTAP